MSSILFLAPFEELAEEARLIIRKMNISIEVIVASNEEAVEIAKARPDKTILISRGGTANDLSAIPEKTVVEVAATFTDIVSELEGIIFSGYKKIGIVTNDNIVDNITKDFVFGNVQIWLRPCRTHTEIRNMVQRLHDSGVEFIIGCHQAVNKAKELHIANEYINSGKLSIEKAIYEAQRIEKMRQLSQFQMERLNTVINNIQEGIVIFEENKHPVFFNSVANNVLNKEAKNTWHDIMAKQLPANGKERVITLGDEKVLLKKIPLELDHNLNDVFIFQEAKKIERQERQVRLSVHQKGFYAKKHFQDIFTASDKMKAVLQRAEKFASTDSNVLIYGETGTGKEGLAQSIHNASSRADHPFVSVNCASLPPGLVESELFGYVDGAFTGARRSGKPGLFEMAHKGTIFLDEIGELPLEIQGRLLRVLQEREVMRIGDDRIIPLDIRVICATNRDLLKSAKEDKFRFDLYYRINVLRITLPPLRERVEDIWPLFSLYFQKYGNNKDLQITEQAKGKLLHYNWPGNIRELKNIAEVMAFEEGTITEGLIEEILDGDSTLHEEPAGNKLVISAGASLQAMEKELLNQLLDRLSPDEVCAQLGISRVTLWRRLHDVSNKKR